MIYHQRYAKLNRKHAQEDQGSYWGKRWSYKLLNSKIIESQKTAPMSGDFVLVQYFMSFDSNHMTQVTNSS